MRGRLLGALAASALAIGALGAAPATANVDSPDIAQSQAESVYVNVTCNGSRATLNGTIEDATPHSQLAAQYTITRNFTGGGSSSSLEALGRVWTGTYGTGGTNTAYEPVSSSIESVLIYMEIGDSVGIGRATC